MDAQPRKKPGPRPKPKSELKAYRFTINFPLARKKELLEQVKKSDYKSTSEFGLNAVLEKLDTLAN